MNICNICKLVVVAVFLVSCSASYQAPIADRTEYTRVKVYTVKRGETLYSISWENGLNYVDVARWNGIAPPYDIFPGQKLHLTPYQLAKKRSQASSVTRSQQSARARKKQAPTSKPEANSVDTDHGLDNRAIGQWIWPTRGKLIRAFSEKEVGKKGIAIAGKLGQPIVATASGKVVYSGYGLIRYGELIIIKHNKTFFSAYAHNRKLLVKEGDLVKQGQKIAEMGNTGTDQIMLHFEIRKNGQPVNPLRYLSAK